MTLSPPSTRVLRWVHVGLSLGLCLVLERLGADRRWAGLLWAAVLLNELRGLWVAASVLQETCIRAQNSLAFCSAVW